MFFMTIERFGFFLEKCKKVFAPKEMVETNTDNLDYYILSIPESWYNENLTFDVSEAAAEANGDGNA